MISFLKDHMKILIFQCIFSHQTICETLTSYNQHIMRVAVMWYEVVKLPKVDISMEQPDEDTSTMPK